MAEQKSTLFISNPIRLDSVPGNAVVENDNTTVVTLNDGSTVVTLN